MTLKELENLIATLRHMIDTSQYLNETKKSILLHRLDEVQTILHKEDFI